MISQSDVQFAPAQDGFRRTRPCEDHPSPRSGLRNVEPGVSTPGGCPDKIVVAF
jgi:hypothetical protein